MSAKYPIPAFPNRGDGETWDGLSKRELFAAMAMQGTLSNPAILERHGLIESDVAAASVKFADALIEKLAEGRAA